MEGGRLGEWKPRLLEPRIVLDVENYDEAMEALRKGPDLGFRVLDVAKLVIRFEYEEVWG
jgi:hypothetical protein